MVLKHRSELQQFKSTYVLSNYKSCTVTARVVYRCVLKNAASHIRYLWLDLNKTKIGINHFKNTIGTM
jgi:hypothetical protein